MLTINTVCSLQLWLLSHGMAEWHSIWVSAILSWKLDDNLFQWFSTQHHYRPLQLDITLFATAWNHIYLLKWAINVRMVFPEDGEPAWESSFFFFFTIEGTERETKGSPPDWSDKRRNARWALPCGTKIDTIQSDSTDRTKKRPVVLIEIPVKLGTHIPLNITCLDVVNNGRALLYLLKCHLFPLRPCNYISMSLCWNNMLR